MNPLILLVLAIFSLVPERAAGDIIRRATIPASVRDLGRKFRAVHKQRQIKRGNRKFKVRRRKWKLLSAVGC